MRAPSVYLPRVYLVNRPINCLSIPACHATFYLFIRVQTTSESGFCHSLLTHLLVIETYSRLTSVPWSCGVMLSAHSRSGTNPQYAHSSLAKGNCRLSFGSRPSNTGHVPPKWLNGFAASSWQLMPLAPHSRRVDPPLNANRRIKENHVRIRRQWILRISLRTSIH